MVSILIVALATLKTVQLLRESTKYVMPAWLKSLLAITISIALFAGLKRFGVRTTILSGLASAGLAAILHELHRFLRAAGDVKKMTIMANLPRRNAPPPR